MAIQAALVKALVALAPRVHAVLWFSSPVF